MATHKTVAGLLEVMVLYWVGKWLWVGERFSRIARKPYGQITSTKPYIKVTAGYVGNAGNHM